MGSTSQGSPWRRTAEKAHLFEGNPAVGFFKILFLMFFLFDRPLAALLDLFFLKRARTKLSQVFKIVLRLGHTQSKMAADSYG